MCRHRAPGAFTQTGPVLTAAHPGALARPSRVACFYNLQVPPTSTLIDPPRSAAAPATSTPLALIAQDMREWLDGQPGWRAIGIAPSAIEGSDGNREFLLAGIKDRA